MHSSLTYTYIASDSHHATKFTSLVSFVASIHLCVSLQVFPLSFQVIAVDADAVNLAYIRKSLQKNLLWGNGGVSLIHNAVRWLFFVQKI